MSALLEARDLGVRFRAGSPFAPWRRTAIDAVAGVSFDLEPGRTLALVGESGSGKTTLALALVGLLPVRSGEVRFDGQRTTDLDRAGRQRLRREISIVFQDPVGSLSPRFTVGASVAEPLRIHGVTDRDPRAEVERLLSLVGLPAAIAARYPHQLSGGQARRVGVARALALSPRLIVADEPTAGLDVSVQGEVLNLLNDLRERLGLAMLIITHNLHVVRHIADDIAIMYLGRFVETGDAEAVFHAPRHPYGAALLSACPQPDPDARRERLAIDGEVPSLLARPTGCEFHTRCPFVQERCRTEAPAMRRDTDGRQFACHFPLPQGA